MNVLGLSFFYHDSAAALIANGRVVAMAQEERFSRKKNDSSFPDQAINFCLRSSGLKGSDLNAIVFYEKPLLKFERLLFSSLATYPLGERLFRKGMKETFFHKLWVKDLIIDKLSVSREKIFFVDHHLSHAASCFYPSGFNESAIVTVDAVGEWLTTMIAYGSKRAITPISEIHFPHSLGLFYSTFTAFLGFEVNEGEYKVMGMAPFGKPRFVDRIKKIIHLHSDGSFSLDLSYFAYPYAPDTLINDKFISLFGKPRDPESLFFTARSGYPNYFGPKPKKFKQLLLKNHYYADVAASVQVVLNETLVNLTRRAQVLTRSKYLTLAGGIALNSVANSRIKETLQLKGLFVQPAAGDAGGALGAALYYYNTMSAQPKPFVQKSVFYGEDYTNSFIRQFLIKNKIPYTQHKTNNDLVKHIISEILLGRVVGWFQGRFEWGPRALGHRSILADPRNHKMKDIVNIKIKFREPFRPFAASVLSDHTVKYFNYFPLGETDPSFFMLVVVPVREEVKKKIPAVTHIDGSCRIQLVTEQIDRLYWLLIREFYNQTGVPLLLNTSFNLKGEPIVDSPESAFRTFTRSDLDILVLGRYTVSKH